MIVWNITSKLAQIKCLSEPNLGLCDYAKEKWMFLLLVICFVFLGWKKKKIKQLQTYKIAPHVCPKPAKQRSLSFIVSLKWK